MADTKKEKNEVDGIHDNAMPLVDKQDDNGIIIENTDLDVSSHRRQRCKASSILTTVGILLSRVPSVAGTGGYNGCRDSSS
ncbi:hypothetical protein LSH36_34g03058 [Paralvinella palmiformis]|uniref:Uncharacterized protein n=1 Tax=Paralvinella palmiformis TaxID=53620 RepID=A0AAD9KAG3_9ANNE|nr:hypothetical protein LSH36_34g03058 [Paralvinella palmiformis]